ncbi:hypothetical protein ACFZA1_30425 [Streptomyces filipinensis]|uniref:hypothetical protein n=1 Tax=Streptomyces filipinensis TaxID=66887 RepID=UPI0036ED39D9
MEAGRRSVGVVAEHVRERLLLLGVDAQPGLGGHPHQRRQEKLAAWTTAHERRTEAALAALDDSDRLAIAETLPVLFQLAERLGVPAAAELSRSHNGPLRGM